MDVPTISRLWNRSASRITAYCRKLTVRDFACSTTDHFFGLDWMLAVAGARLTSTNVRIRRAWNVYRCVIYLPIFVVAWNLYLNVRKQAGLGILLSCTQALVASVSLSVRTWIVLWYYEPLMDVRRYVNRRKFGRHLQRSYGIRSETFYRIRKTMIVVTGLITSIVASFLAIDIGNHHYFKLPFDFGERFPALQILCEKAYCLTFTGIGMRPALVYLIVYMILAALESEVKVISELVAHIFDSVEIRVRSKLESEPGTSQRQDLMEKYYFWKFTQEEFSDCIEQIGEFLAMKNKVRSFLNAIFLIVYYSNVLCLSCGAAYLTQMKTMTIFSLETLSYCFWVTLECASLTKLVSLLTEANESTQQKIRWQNRMQKHAHHLGETNHLKLHV